MRSNFCLCLCSSPAPVLSTLDTTGGPGSGDPGRSIGFRRASDARTRLVNKWEREALGAARARRDCKLAADTLRKPAVDARLLAVLARRIGVLARKFSVEVLGIFAVLESEGLSIWWGGGRLLRWFRCGRFRRRCRRRCVLDIVVVARIVVVVSLIVVAVVAVIAIPLNATCSPGSGDPGRSICFRRASNARTRLVNKWESEALGATRARRDCKLAADTLRKPAVDARLLAILARRIGVLARKFSVEVLGIFAVLESEGLSIWWGGGRLLRWFGCGRFRRRCGRRRVLDIVVIARIIVVVALIVVALIATPLDAPSGTGGGDASLGILLSSAGDTGARLVDEGEGEALSAARAPNFGELAIHALSESTINARVIAPLARRVGSQGGEVGTTRSRQ